MEDIDSTKLSFTEELKRLNYLLHIFNVNTGETHIDLDTLEFLLINTIRVLMSIAKIQKIQAEEKRSALDRLLDPEDVDE